MGGEFIAFVMAVSLPAKFLLKPAKGFLDVGSDSVGFQHLLLGELYRVGAKVKVAPAEYLDQEAKTFEFAFFDPEDRSMVFELRRVACAIPAKP